jgi:hypothetical protein
MWRLGSRMGVQSTALAQLRLSAFLAVTALFVWMGLKGYLGRTTRRYIAGECPPKQA